MKITMESTRQVTEVITPSGSVPARVWEGTTAGGVPVQVLVTPEPRISPRPPQRATIVDKPVGELKPGERRPNPTTRSPRVAPDEYHHPSSDADGWMDRFGPLGDWADKAACSGADRSMFFPGRGEEVSDAKKVCATCPVIEECRGYALRAGKDLYGIWGGLSEKQRKELRRGLNGSSPHGEMVMS